MGLTWVSLSLIEDKERLSHHVLFGNMNKDLHFLYQVRMLNFRSMLWHNFKKNAIILVYFTKEVSPSLAKPPSKFIGGLTKIGLISLVKSAAIRTPIAMIWIQYVLNYPGPERRCLTLFNLVLGTKIDQKCILCRIFILSILLDKLIKLLLLIIEHGAISEAWHGYCAMYTRHLTER